MPKFSLLLFFYDYLGVFVNSKPIHAKEAFETLKEYWLKENE